MTAPGSDFEGREVLELGRRENLESAFQSWSFLYAAGVTMKTLIALLSTLVIFSSVRAQETAAPEPKPEAMPEKPAATDSASQPLADPMSLIPETPPTIDKPGTPSNRDLTSPVRETPENAAKNATTSAAADALKERIRFREVKTRAVQNEKVQEQWDHAQAAKTDPEKRAELKRYYTLLYAQMLKIDGSLAATIKLHKDEAINRLLQPNVYPSDRVKQ